MATTHPHNVIYAQNSSEIQEPLAHSRNVSTLSTATLFTSTTLHSQPTEPLLQPSPSDRTTYVDATDELAKPDASHCNGGPNASFCDSNAEVDEKQRGLNQSGQRRRGLRWVLRALEFLMACWAAYNSVRYCLAFATYDHSTAQAYALALGISTGAAACLILCLFALTTLARTLLHRANLIKHVATTVSYVSTFLLLAPAAVNLVLLFVTKDSTDSQLNLNQRCGVDVDLLWSIVPRLCEPHESPRTIWIALSSIRLGLTLIVTIGYHTLSSYLRRSESIPTRRHSRLEASHIRSNAAAGLLSSSNRASETLSPEAHDDLTPQRHPSHSSLSMTSRTDSTPLHTSRIRLARSHSSGMSGETIYAEGSPSTLTPLPEGDQDSEADGFVDRFRSLIVQVNRETEDALEHARSDHSRSPEDDGEDHPIRPPNPPYYDLNRDDYYDYDDNEDDLDDYYTNRPSGSTSARAMFGLPDIPPALGYNEFGIPYPPNENVRVLNGLIRKMPTIESMGSGEITNSSIGASSRHFGATSLHTSSRPPTRSTHLSWSSVDHDSRPSSRANSLSIRLDHTGRRANRSSTGNSTSEMGELLSRAEGGPAGPGGFVRRMSSTPSSPLSVDGYSIGTAESRGTDLSYHTATMGSADGYPGPGAAAS